MLERRTAPNGVVFYASPLLDRPGVPHAFSTRLGGHSPPPFDSLNLGNPNGCDVQDDYAHIWGTTACSRRRRAARPASCAGCTRCTGRGSSASRRGEPFDKSTKGDALVGDDPTRAIAVRVADCAPVLLATDDGEAWRPFTPGWRGVVAGVAPAACGR